MINRQQELESFIGTIFPNWAMVRREIDARLDSLIVELIGTENPEIRGRIKALRDLKDLPDALLQELEAIKAELTE